MKSSYSAGTALLVSETKVVRKTFENKEEEVSRF
jgi:hypothetical protein